VRTGTLVMILGTSTCDCAIAPAADDIATVPGICGIVNGSIMPDYFGIEAGQSAVGDLLKWWVERFCQGDESMHGRFSEAAAKLAPGESGLVALDWNNGNRTILVDARLTGLLIGQTLYTTPVEVYRALIEATAFGARAIVERMREYGVAIDRVVCCGGIAEKNDLFMQIYADVLGQPMLIAGSPQTPALGAAVSAAVTAGQATGGYDDWTEAQDRMTTLKAKRFEPRAAAKQVYDELYGIYRELHDAFGGVPGNAADLGSLMKRLLAIKERAAGAAAATNAPDAASKDAACR
jgi:L-ribulokinase